MADFSSFALASQGRLFSVISGSYISKTGDLPMWTRSCIDGSHVQNKEPHRFYATEQISLSRSTSSALLIPLRLLQKQDLDMYYSVYSSDLFD